MNYIFDACALLTYLKNEDGADIVDKLLAQVENGEATGFCSIINLLEVYYDRLKTQNMDETQKFLDFLEAAPIEILWSVSAPVFREAGRLKASYKISLADSILLATGLCTNAAVITSDHHEMDVIEETEDIQFLWTR
jgi:predicted nucleic acid-binding protein